MILQEPNGRVIDMVSGPELLTAFARMRIPNYNLERMKGAPETTNPN